MKIIRRPLLWFLFLWASLLPACAADEDRAIQTARPQATQLVKHFFGDPPHSDLVTFTAHSLVTHGLNRTNHTLMFGQQYCTAVPHAPAENVYEKTQAVMTILHYPGGLTEGHITQIASAFFEGFHTHTHDVNYHSAVLEALIGLSDVPLSLFNRVVHFILEEELTVPTAPQAVAEVAPIFVGMRAQLASHHEDTVLAHIHQHITHWSIVNAVTTPIATEEPHSTDEEEGYTMREVSEEERDYLNLCDSGYFKTNDTDTEEDTFDEYS